MTQTVLVTGASGFVASWTLLKLLQQGYEVRGTVRTSKKGDLVRSELTDRIGADLTQHLTFYEAELTDSKGWDAAMAGVDTVLHIASPLGADNPNDEAAMIRPAVDGVNNVFQAATDAHVSRIIMTSSLAAATPPSQDSNPIVDEHYWSSRDNPELNAYRKSKLLAESAAWNFVAHHEDAPALTTILPGAIFGPAMTKRNTGSDQFIAQLMNNRIGNPPIGFEIVDVRDLADLHIAAMQSDQAKGQRYVAANDYLTATEISRILKTDLGSACPHVSLRTIPGGVLKLGARFIAPLRALTPMIGRQFRYTHKKAVDQLDWHPRSGRQTVDDTAKSLLKLGVFQKS
ncbi:NAD-dependent epimerase/dehydratase family protein [Levilactobacillus bambusae]|uniref:Epimerase n=1 Tax=Levilactobacillus bambusae TaxID=2024736 RepID=A0A2V1MZN5_9LACO|nr:NAD-dependent epimerase/dehydratase family protein [Levilactobacillus bambusae]PWG00282.1 epimerase [Levilactobacillus bambusae]